MIVRSRVICRCDLPTAVLRFRVHNSQWRLTVLTSRDVQRFRSAGHRSHKVSDLDSYQRCVRVDLNHDRIQSSRSV